MRCHLEGPGQAGEMGQQESHEVQQQETPSPALRVELYICTYMSLKASYGISYI